MSTKKTSKKTNKDPLNAPIKKEVWAQITGKSHVSELMDEINGSIESNTSTAQEALDVYAGVIRGCQEAVNLLVRGHKGSK